jgi:hypothetical protein
VTFTPRSTITSLCAAADAHTPSAIAAKTNPNLQICFAITKRYDITTGRKKYLRDAALSGQKKGMILISHEAGEEAGMVNFASWLRTFITEVPVAFVSTRDQMWIPA